jgi:hypothetical protein
MSSHLSIDISDLCPIIKALWRNTKPVLFYPCYLKEPSDQYILDTLSRSEYIDYISGRYIGIDFSDLTIVNTEEYNRNNGNNAFENIVAKLR